MMVSYSQHQYTVFPLSIASWLRLFFRPYLNCVNNIPLDDPGFYEPTAESGTKDSYPECICPPSSHPKDSGQSTKVCYIMQ